MKRTIIAILTMVTLVILGACTKNSERSKGSETTAMTSETQHTTDQSSSNVEKEQSVFTAVLVEDAKKNESQDQSIRLVLNKVEAIEDPEKIVNMMKNDGVILNVSLAQLADGMTEENLKTGDKIQFTLAGLPAMTMSIPPQVAGNSVVKVEKI